MADKNTIIGIEDLTNNVRYMGVAESLDALTDHQKQLKAGKHGNAELQSAWDAHGADNFRLSHLGTMGSPDVAAAVMQNMFDAITANQKLGHHLAAKPL